MSCFSLEGQSTCACPLVLLWRTTSRFRGRSSELLECLVGLTPAHYPSRLHCRHCGPRPSKKRPDRRRRTRDSRFRRTRPKQPNLFSVAEPFEPLNNVLTRDQNAGKKLNRFAHHREAATWMSTNLAPSCECCASMRMRPVLFGRALIHTAPAPPLSARLNGLSAIITPGLSIENVTSPPANNLGALNLSTTWNISRVASAPSPRIAGSSARSSSWSAAASAENEREDASRSPR